MAASARAFTRRFLETNGVPGDTVDTATLLANELAVNAILHARSQFTVVLDVQPDECVFLEVIDDNARLPEAAATPDEATSGRGLQVVGHMAASWGAERNADCTKTVWCELSWDERDEDVAG